MIQKKLRIKDQKLFYHFLELKLSLQVGMNGTKLLLKLIKYVIMMIVVILLNFSQPCDINSMTQDEDADLNAPGRLKAKLLAGEAFR